MANSPFIYGPSGATNLVPNALSNNFIDGYTTTATAAGTTTLTVSSTYQQYFTGSTTQTVLLPVVSTLVLGQQFQIVNSSSGIVTVQSSGGNTIQAMAANTTLTVTVISLSGTGTASWSAVYLNGAITAIVNPTVQTFTSGSGTYTTPAGVQYIVVTQVGGGGGGGGSGTSTSGGAGGNGSASTFGTTLLSAGGGSGGPGGSFGVGGAGGTSSLGSGPIGSALTGGYGSASPVGAASAADTPGGIGGSSFFGGAGSGGGPASKAGVAGVANTGGGGGGAGGSGGSTNGGGGGGAGGYVNAIINSPAATYPYAVGTAGTAGAAGTSGFAGGAGGSGYIEVREYYGALQISNSTSISSNLVLAGPSSGSAAAPTFRALTTPDYPGFNYYSGFMSTASSWTTNSTSFADGTNTGGNALTQRFTSGLTVTAGASNVAGITFTPSSTTAVYVITAQFPGYNTAASIDSGYRLFDSNSNTLTTHVLQQQSTSAVAVFPVSMTGICVPGSTSPITVKIQILTSNASNAATIAPLSGSTTTIEWTVLQVKN